MENHEILINEHLKVTKDTDPNRSDPNMWHLHARKDRNSPWRRVQWMYAGNLEADFDIELPRYEKAEPKTRRVR